jgi:hypothetical protein
MFNLSIFRQSPVNYETLYAKRQALNHTYFHCHNLIPLAF